MQSCADAFALSAHYGLVYGQLSARQRPSRRFKDLTSFGTQS
ncbi:hypothetical protein [Candidatus Phycosocius spiralis]|nr:hypothetical protein [Candidatus Phycosocius spiralis]